MERFRHNLRRVIHLGMSRWSSGQEERLLPGRFVTLNDGGMGSKPGGWMGNQDAKGVGKCAMGQTL